MADKSLSAKYELFCNLLLEEKMFHIPSLSYSRLCALIHADEKALEGYIYGELGSSGQELIDGLRDNFLSYLFHKYGEDAFR